LLGIGLNISLFHLLFKLFILVELLSEVPEGLALRVEEEIFELSEVELDLRSFLLVVWL
jgi:hypothetical protein